MPQPNEAGNLITFNNSRWKANDDLEEMVLHLRRKADSLEAQAKEHREIADRIEKAQQMRDGGMSIPRVKPDEYKGMRPIDALEVYLRSRRQFTITLANAVQDFVFRWRGAWAGSWKKRRSRRTHHTKHQDRPTEPKADFCVDSRWAPERDSSRRDHGFLG